VKRTISIIIFISIAFASTACGGNNTDGLFTSAIESTAPATYPTVAADALIIYAHTDESQNAYSSVPTALVDENHYTHLYLHPGNEQYGNLAGNISNFAQFAYADGWIYAARGNLYKLRLDGTERTLLYNGWPESVHVVGDWVYFSHNSPVGISKIRTDGTDFTRISTESPVFLNVVGDWMYFQYTAADSQGRQFTGIAKMRTDGTERTSLAEGRANSINVVDDWIFWSSGQGVYRMRTDGTERMQLLDAFVNTSIVSGGWLYYSDPMRNLFRIRVDGTENTLLGEAGAIFTVAGDRLFFIGDNGYVYRMDIEIMETTRIRNVQTNNIQNLHILEDWLFFRTRLSFDSPFQFFRIRFDGSGSQAVLED